MAGLEGLGGVLTQQLVTGVQGVSGPTGPGTAPAVGATSDTDGAGPQFAAAMATSMEQVQALHATSSELAVRAATGDLTDVHDYTIASTQAKIATEVTVAVRNKGLEAFNDIMRMQV